MNRLLLELVEDMAESPEADTSTLSPPDEGLKDANTIGLRIAAIFIILSAGLLGGVPPLFIRSLRNQNSLTTFLIRAFAAGVILALAMVHIVPEAVEELTNLGGVTYPIGGTCVLFGVVIMVFIEHSAHLMYGMPHVHSHGGVVPADGHSPATPMPVEAIDTDRDGAVVGVVETGANGSGARKARHGGGQKSVRQHTCRPVCKEDVPVALDADCGGYMPPPPPTPPPPPAAPPPPPPSLPQQAALDLPDHCRHPPEHLQGDPPQQQQPQQLLQRRLQHGNDSGLPDDSGAMRRGAVAAASNVLGPAPAGRSRHAVEPVSSSCLGPGDRADGACTGQLHASSTPLLDACESRSGRTSSDGSGAAGDGAAVLARCGGAAAAAGTALAAGEGDGTGLQRALLLHCQPGHAHDCVSRASAPNWMSAVEVTVEGGQPLRLRIVAYLFELGCIFHSFIIGLSLGVNQTSLSQVRALLIALSFHQALEGLSLASVINGGGFSTIKSALMIVMYSITCPAGVAVGIAIAASYDPESVKARAAQGILNGVSGGMLLYISLVQLVAEDMGKYLGGASGGHSHAAHHASKTAAPVAAAARLNEQSGATAGADSAPAIKLELEDGSGTPGMPAEVPAGWLPGTGGYLAEGTGPDPGKHDAGMGYRIRVPSFLAFTAGAASMCVLAVWA